MRSLAGVGGALAGLASAGAAAQDGELVLEEIVVTAQKREEPLQDVPVSIVAIDGAHIEESASFRLRDLQAQVPNFRTSETALSSNISIRGIFSGANQGFEQSVGTYVDGLYRGRSQQTRAPFVDLERIEVLRGSQNILFGRNSVAGALNLVPARPTDVFSGSLSLLHEPELERDELTAVFSGPVGESMLGRLAVLGRSSGGYIHNLTLDRDEPQRDDWLIRGTLAWQPREGLDMSLRIEASGFDVKGREIEVIDDNAATIGPFAGVNYSQILASLGQHPSVLNTTLDGARSANGDFSNNDTAEAAFTLEHEVGNLTLTSVTGYSGYKYDEACDCDFTGGNVFRVPQREDFDQVSQEVRLASPSGQDLEYLVGFYYQSTDLQFFDTLAVDDGSIIVPVVNALTQSMNGQFLANTGTPRFFNQEATTWSAFGQSTWQLGSDFALTGGLRVSRETKEASRSLEITDIGFEPLAEPAATIAPLLFAGLFNVRPHSLSGKRTETLVMPSVTLAREYGAGSMAYVKLSRGAKSGGFDPRSNNPLSAGGGFEFEDESADNLEAGMKHSLGRAAELNLAVYRTNIEDMQVSTYDGVLGYNVTNAGEARTQGIELDARWAAARNLIVRGSLAVSDFEFKDYTGQCYFGQPPDAPDGINCNYAGKTNQFVPDYHVSLRTDHVLPLTRNLVFRSLVAVTLIDDFFRTPTLDPSQIQKAYTKLDARVSIGELDGKWEVALIGENLTDEDIVGYAIYVPLAGASFGTPGDWGMVDAPRTVAVQATFRF